MNFNTLFKRLFGLSAAIILGVYSASAEEMGDAQVDASESKDNVIPVIQIGTSQLRIMGYGQTAYTAQWQDGESSNSMDMQRFVLMADAKISDNVSFWLMYDVAASKLHEYYAQYAFNPAVKVRVGQFKQPFTIESLLPPTLISNVNMDESIAYMAGIGGDPCFGMGRVGRDMGIMLTGDAIVNNGKPLLNYSIGVFNGAGMNQKENNNQKDVIGQINVMPLPKTMFSASFILGTAHAQAPSPYGKFVAGDNYRRNRFSVGAEHKNSIVNLRSEAMWGNDGGVKSMGWYANAEFHLCKGLDLVANYDYLERNMDIDGSSTTNLIGGLQYWVYKQCCVRSQYVYKNPKASSSTNMWVTQFQIAF